MIGPGLYELLLAAWQRVPIAALTMAALDTSPPTAVAPAAPRSARDTVLVLPEVTVERARHLLRHLPTAFSTELRPGAEARAVESLAELLAAAPGVRVTQYGGLGSFSTVSLRGAPPGQVAVTLDGMPIQSASQGTVNLSDLPLGAVERVIVHRGVAPLESGALPGGAVRLVTRGSPGPLEARAARGSFDTWESAAGGGLARGPVSLIVHGGYLGSAGDFRFHDDNGTPFNAADDSVSARINNRFDSAHGLATVAWRAPHGVRAAVRHHQFHRAQGVPGIGVSPARHPRLAFDRALSQIELARAAAGLTPEVAVRASLQRDRSRFRDTAAELRPARADRDDRFRGSLAGIETRWPGRGGLVSLAASGSRRHERAEPHDALNAAATPAAATRATLGGALAVTFEPWSGALLLRAAQRWDRMEDALHGPGAATAAATRETRVPQLGARARLPFGFELRANWTDAERPPDFTERFGDQGSVQGNANLLPERGESWDAGGRWDLLAGPWRAFLEVAHFESDARNLIVYVRNSPSTVRASNVSRAEITGDELALRLEAPGGFTVTASGTAMRAVDRGAIRAWSGKRLPGRPDRMANARLDWSRGGLRLALHADHLGDNYLDPANRRPVSERTLLGALATIPLRRAAWLTVEGRNLGDRRVHDVGGYPLPGRSVFASLEARFGDSHP